MAVGDLPPEPRIRPSIRQAWQNMWPNFWWLLLFGFLAALAGGTGMAPPDVDPIWIGVNVVSGLVGIFVGIPLGFGVVKAHLAASRGQKPTWQDLGYAFSRRYWPSLGLGLLTVLIIVGGLVLLIVPGIYLAVRLAFTQQRFVEDGLGVRDSLRASFTDTKGRWWNVFGLVLMAIPLVIAGLLALVVGVFVAFVLISQMQVVYWRSIREGAQTSWIPASPPGPPATSAAPKAATTKPVSRTGKPAKAKPAKSAKSAKKR